MIVSRPSLLGLVVLLVFLGLGLLVQGFLPGLGVYVYRYSALLLFLSLGGVLALVFTFVGEALLPGFVYDLVRAVKTGFLLILMGSDGKVRLLPASSDGHFVYPEKKPYSEKYVFAADARGVMSVHNGKGVRAVLSFAKYPFTLDPSMAAAITAFRRRYSTIDDLFAALRAYSEIERMGGRSAVEAELDELRKALDMVNEASDEELEKMGVKNRAAVAEQISSRIRYLEGLLEAAPRSREELEARLGTVTISASDLVDYLVWRHHPADLKKIINAETAAAMEKVRESWFQDWWRKWLPIIVIVGLVVMGVAWVIHTLSGGGGPELPQPLQTISIGGGG